ncbi:hypothetical protein HCN44_005393 [Aphidius gifuensis]|uniref:Phospholipid scramblase n=1 Tax=Aphidius gifuensis TaxID=684658 RepID=A0A834Y320_APHGI|nr:hypothetical protein HCN44_005393 [Aphidius gifuensis]
MPVNHDVLFSDREYPTPPLQDADTWSSVFDEPLSTTAPVTPRIHQDSRNNIVLQRRPIPISTQDWISTNSPQLSPLTAEDFLSNVEQLEIHLVIDLSTLLGQSKNGNQYKVKVPGGETLFISLEYSNRWQRILFGSSRYYDIILKDASGEFSFCFIKNFSFGFLPGFLHKMIVKTNDFIGSIEQEYSLISQRFKIYNENREIICHIEGPNMCCCCIGKDISFHVLSADKSIKIASISHQWDQQLADNILLLTFSENINVRVKSILLGAAFLMVNFISIKYLSVLSQ